MMLKRTTAIVLLSMLQVPGALAAMYGTPSERDGRIQTVDYNEQDVFNVRVKAGAQTTIKFGQDETIKDVGIGYICTMVYFKKLFARVYAIRK